MQNAQLFRKGFLLGAGLHRPPGIPGLNKLGTVHNRIKAVWITKLSQEYRSLYGIKAYFLEEVKRVLLEKGKCMAPQARFLAPKLFMMEFFFLTWTILGGAYAGSAPPWIRTCDSLTCIRIFSYPDSQLGNGGVRISEGSLYVYLNCYYLVLHNSRNSKYCSKQYLQTCSIIKQ